jgi:hypothetical protein
MRSRAGLREARANRKAAAKHSKNAGFTFGGESARWQTAKRDLRMTARRLPCDVARLKHPHLHHFGENSRPACFLRSPSQMGYVVKITGHSQLPQWIGHNTLIGPKRLVTRDEARVFPTEAEAEWEIDTFRPLLPDGAQFELEDE